MGMDEFKKDLKEGFENVKDTIEDAVDELKET